MDTTAVAADRLTSCIASDVVVVLLPDEEWPTVVFSGTAVKQCSNVQDGPVRGARGRGVCAAVGRLVWSATRFNVVEGERCEGVVTR